MISFDPNNSKIKKFFNQSKIMDFPDVRNACLWDEEVIILPSYYAYADVDFTTHNKVID